MFSGGTETEHWVKMGQICDAKLDHPPGHRA